MADFSFPQLPAVTPPPQTSLADMMGIARGAQAYQQAEQINPLELQAKELALRQAQQINPLALEQQQSATQTAQQAAATGGINLNILKQKDLERQNLQTFFSDPGNFQTDGRIDINKINKVVPTLAPLTGSDYVKNLSDLSTAQTAAEKASMGLTQDDRQLVSSALGIVGRAGVQDPQIVINEMRMLVDQNPNNKHLKSLVENAYVPIFSKMQPGANVADASIKASQSILTPVQQQTTFAPTTAVTTENRVVTTTPSVGAGAPCVSISTAGGLQSGAPSANAPVPAGTEVAPGMRVPYPVRSAAQPFIAEPTEAKDQAAGAEYRNNLVNNQMSLTQGRRNVQEVIKQATGINEKLYFPEGGIFGQAEQKILSALKSDQYDLLAKDLANMHITNSRAMGTVGGTVAGLDMAAVAGGTVKVPPKVLIDIARRVQADQTNLDMQANGAQQFSQKFGDNNMKAYQQAWTANARDTKIFEAMNLLENETDPTKLKTEFEKLFPTEKKRKTILKQYKNLKSLAATGLQAQPLSPEDF